MDKIKTKLSCIAHWMNEAQPDTHKIREALQEITDLMIAAPPPLQKKHFPEYHRLHGLYFNSVIHWQLEK